MSYTAPTPVVTGDLYPASQHNTDVVFNIIDHETRILAVPVVSYAATLHDVRGNVEGTTETTILSFTVPANDWADGDVIYVQCAILGKNNKGSDGGILLKVNAGAGAQVTLGSATFSDLATEYKSIREFWLQRIGADVWVYNRPDNTQWVRGAEDSTAAGVSTPANFTSTVTVSLKATLDATDASFYIKPQKARILRVR